MSIFKPLRTLVSFLIARARKLSFDLAVLVMRPQVVNKRLHSCVGLCCVLHLLCARMGQSTQSLYQLVGYLQKSSSKALLDRPLTMLSSGFHYLRLSQSQKSECHELRPVLRHCLLLTDAGTLLRVPQLDPCRMAHH